MSAGLDAVALLGALDAVEGSRFLGVVVSGQCVELVFTDDAPLNLVSIFVDGVHAGMTVLGGVATPESYARSCRRWRPWGVLS